MFRESSDHPVYCLWSPQGFLLVGWPLGYDVVFFLIVSCDNAQCESVQLSEVQMIQLRHRHGTTLMFPDCAMDWRSFRGNARFFGDFHIFCYFTLFIFTDVNFRTFISFWIVYWHMDTIWIKRTHLTILKKYIIVSIFQQKIKIQRKIGTRIYSHGFAWIKTKMITKFKKV